MAEPIIDFHVHPSRRAEEFLNFYPETEPMDAMTLRSRLERAGITHICGSVIGRSFRADSFEDVRALNREALELQEELGDFYTPGFHIHPAFPEESCREIEDMHRRGVRLMGELVPYLHDWGDGKGFLEILDAAHGLGMVCSYHTPTDYDMDEILSAHPDTVFVAAHPGDRDRLPEHIDRMRHHENLYLDLSGTGLFRLGMLKHLICRVGADRILFGTDFPICNPDMYVHAVYGEDISEADRRKVFFENAARLLGLPL